MQESTITQSMKMQQSQSVEIQLAQKGSWCFLLASASAWIMNGARGWG